MVMPLFLPIVDLRGQVVDLSGAQTAERGGTVHHGLVARRIDALGQRVDLDGLQNRQRFDHVDGNLKKLAYKLVFSIKFQLETHNVCYLISSVYLKRRPKRIRTVVSAFGVLGQISQADVALLRGAGI